MYILYFPTGGLTAVIWTDFGQTIIMLAGGIVLMVLGKEHDLLATAQENEQNGWAKTKVQISFAVTAKLISTFVFAAWIVQSFSFLNPKFQACFCDCTGWFVSDLVGTQIVGFLTRRLY